MQRRSTNQRQIVYEAIDLLGHSTSDELIDYLEKNNSPVSLATIYRNISILIEDGQVKKLKLGTSDVYETTKEKHYHFQCTCCKKITDIPMKDIPEIPLEKEYMGNQVTDYELVLFGTCSYCKKIKREEKENEEVCM